MQLQLCVPGEEAKQLQVCAAQHLSQLLLQLHVHLLLLYALGSSYKWVDTSTLQHLILIGEYFYGG